MVRVNPVNYSREAFDFFFVVGNQRLQAIKGGWGRDLHNLM